MMVVASIVLELAMLLIYVGGIRRLWKNRGWASRILYLSGGLLLAIFLVIHASVLMVLGILFIVGSRMVPAHGFRKQPGET